MENESFTWYFESICSRSKYGKRYGRGQETGRKSALTNPSGNIVQRFVDYDVKGLAVLRVFQELRNWRRQSNIMGAIWKGRHLESQGGERVMVSHVTNINGRIER